MHRSIPHSFLEKAQRPVRIDLQPKKPSPSRDLNPACSDRKLLLYRLRHHRGKDWLVVKINVLIRESSN